MFRPSSYGHYDLITASYVEPQVRPLHPCSKNRLSCVRRLSSVMGSLRMVIWRYDADNRPALYLRPSKENTEKSIRLKCDVALQDMAKPAGETAPVTEVKPGPRLRWRMGRQLSRLLALFERRSGCIIRPAFHWAHELLRPIEVA